ncbi:hypothetical protein BOTBODRAFT_176632 [Botryobasidium botryosum FD-172 SS1]|uniref:DUF4110 domain-containing protein n=1 Tax=Botryobasidium botryosum (strain FD-172 SS1) TaxID=930990 RepID=A0A067M946_BOTB1|nr:hypothetical protein BOTBODRAFT_176632 [Botryobasidium botryosum FD-172 SS1]
MGKKKAASAAAAKAQAKAAKKAKASQKAEKRETKKTKKDKCDEEEDDDDLEGILDKAHKVTEETVAGPPSRRANATFTPCPVGNYLWCIGGEYFSDDSKAYFYNDVYRYAPEKDEWRRFTSPNCPGPRSAHAVVASPMSGGKLFLFGGEFSSLYQNTFHHYRDFWCFDIQTRSWDRIDTKIKPSARSGHRMAMWKHFIVLFGGFHDPGIRTNYLNDLWLFDTQEYKWRQVELREIDRKPSSGFSFLPVADGVILHGGYCKIYAKGKRTQGVALEDTWFLKMSLETKEIKWERRKKSGYAPSIRSGCTMALWGARSIGVMFGGVRDDDTSEEGMTSIFFNDMYAYHTAGHGRWTSLMVKTPKKSGGKKAQAKVAAPPPPVPTQRQFERDSDEYDSENDGAGDDDVSTRATSVAPSVISHPAARTTEPDEPVIPLGRYNTMLAVLRNTLYIYSGILERGSREHTLDDFWSIQLDKMDGFNCLRALEVDVTQEGDESSDDDEEDGDGSDGSEEDEDGDEEYEAGEGVEEREEVDADEKLPTESLAKDDLRALANALLDDSKSKERSAAEVISTPLPGETLAVFYARSREHWAQVAHDAGANERGKTLRRNGFTLAEEKYESYKPILEEVERILAEAGLDEEEIKKVGGGGGPGASGESRNRR